MSKIKFISLLVVITTLFNIQLLSAQERREIPPFQIFGTASDQTQRSVEQLTSDFQTNWSAQNTDALMALHAEDVEWINAYARLIRGRDKLELFLEDQLFPAFNKMVSVGEAENMTPISTRYIGEAAAVVHLYTDGNRGASRNEGEVSRRTHIHLVLEKQLNDWKVVHTAIMDAR